MPNDVIEGLNFARESGLDVVSSLADNLAIVCRPDGGVTFMAYHPDGEMTLIVLDPPAGEARC